MRTLVKKKMMDRRMEFVKGQKAATSDHLRAKLRHAMSFHEKGQLARAQSIYLDVVRAYPRHFDAIHLLGVIALQTGGYQKSFELISKAIEIYPSNPVFSYNRGNALFGLKRYDAALEDYDRAIAIKPDYAEAHSNRGIVLQELGQHEAALESYDKALAIKPGYAEAHSNRGNALASLRRTDAAIESYNKAVAIDPNYAEAYSNRGNALRELRQFDAAVENYDKAIAINPDYVEARTNREVAVQERELFVRIQHNETVQRFKPGIKIFFIGFNRTATGSMHALMLKHGIKSVHWTENSYSDGTNLALEIERRLSDTSALKQYLSQWTAFSDFHYVSPDAWLEGNKNYRRFDELFPESFFIFNDRDTDAWIESRLTHGNGMLIRNARVYFGVSEAEVISMWRADKASHTNAVIEYFQGRERFLHYRIDADPHETLTDFLAPVFSIGSDKWPHFNQRK